MIKELMHDPIFLAQKSETADRNDIQTANDLRDTLEANRERPANMIGVKKRMICFVSDGEYMIMFNPEIIKQSDPYDTEEGCLSLLGGPRKCKRYKKIKVKYQNEDMQVRIKTFSDFTAQIIQHETDHCNGILI